MQIANPPQAANASQLTSRHPAPPLPEQIEAAFEEWGRAYHERLGEMSRRGMTLKAEQGVLPGCAPVGYRNIRGGIEVDPILAPLVQRAFARAATSRLPLRSLLAEMTERGLVSRSGRPMQIASFWYMLTNPFYSGRMRWKGRLLPGSHEPLISPELFAAVQERLAEAGPGART
jgi:hypothetical protein